jgi:putative glutamine transport system permease protein
MDFFGAYSYSNIKFLLEGFSVTLQLAFLSIIASFCIAMVIAILRYSQLFVLSKALFFAVQLIRNLPLFLIVFFTYFGLRDIKTKLDLFEAAFISLTLYESALLSEIIRSGLNSVGKGQIEAALSLGLNQFQILFYIITPQALKCMLPAITGQFISLIKDTSLATVIGLPELFYNAHILYSDKPSFILPIFVIIGLLYFSINFSLSLLSKKLILTFK